MKRTKRPIFKTLSLVAAIAGGSLLISACDDEASSPQAGGGGTPPAPITFRYEVWGTDQSNQTPGASALGDRGSAMYIWNSLDVDAQIAGGAKAEPLGCGADAGVAGKGPCQIDDVFPGTLENELGKKLSENQNSGFARMHGSLSDPQNMYMNINMFKTGGTGGFVGIMDGRTKEAVALFQVTMTGKSAGGRSVHMSFWNKDGSALLVANLHGRIVERIDITRDAAGNITNANMNRAAAFSAGSGASALHIEDSHAYSGKNALGNDLISTVSGSYSPSAFNELLPNGECKENGCATGTTSANGGRPGGVIICPIVTDTDMMYLTFGAGGAIVIDSRKTPMSPVAAYGNEELNGAGCGGVHIGNSIWLDGGVSAVGAGAPRSTFTVYTLNDTVISGAANSGTYLTDATKPQVVTVFKDALNTAASGNVGGIAEANTTGQLPGTTTRRDAHGMIQTIDDKYVHVVDRIQNNMEVFDAVTETHIGTYDLVSADGQGMGTGPCAAASVTDGNLVKAGSVVLPTNDPAPDLMGATPDGKYLVVALRGPKPVTVNHGAQGSCPGVGMIELTNGGASGKLVAVLRSTNEVDDFVPGDFTGGANYIGAESADIHGASTRVILP